MCVRACTAVASCARAPVAGIAKADSAPTTRFTVVIVATRGSCDADSGRTPHIYTAGFPRLPQQFLCNFKDWRRINAMHQMVSSRQQARSRCRTTVDDGCGCVQKCTTHHGTFISGHVHTNGYRLHDFPGCCRVSGGVVGCMGEWSTEWVQSETSSELTGFCYHCIIFRRDLVKLSAP